MVGTTPIGGLSRSAAEKRLDTAWNGERRMTITTGQAGSDSWTAGPVEMGLWANPAATVDRAYQLGRGPDGMREVGTLFAEGSITLAPTVVFSRPVSSDRLSLLAAEVNRPPVNATLRLENGRWVGVPAQYGTVLDIEATLERVAAQPETVLASGYFPLATSPVAPHIADPAPLLARLDAALSSPLKIQAYDPITDQTIEWQVPREIFESWVSVEFEDGEPNFHLDPAPIGPYLETWKAKLEPERTLEPFTAPPQMTSLWLSGQPLTILVRHLPTEYIVQPGDTLTRVGFKVGMPYWKIEQANPGRDLQQLSPGDVLVIPSKNEMLPVPVVVGKRIVVNISQQRMWTYENGSLRSEHTISTGIGRSPTYPGIYQVRSHELEAYASVWDLTMPYFLGIYEGWPGFMNGIHGLPMLSNGVRLWGSVLGSPSSYGCVIMSMEESEALYYWADDGVVVEIQP
jgi:lipoprotein-anchoring transpeptidase ErfK/SrfK